MIKAAKYARAAYNLEIRYIGGCCGFEPYHIRAIAEGLKDDKGMLPEMLIKIAVTLLCRDSFL